MIIGIECIPFPAVVHNAKSITIRTGESVTLTRGPTRSKNITVTQAQALTLRRTFRKTVSVNSPQTITLAKAAVHVYTQNITLTSAQSHNVTKTPIVFETETNTWAAAVVTAGGTVSNTRKILVNDLIAGLKSDGVWTKLDRIWIFAAENTQSALIDLKATASVTNVSSVSFTTDRGYTGSGSNYLETDFNPSTAGSPLYVRNDAHWGHWSNTSSGSTNSRYSGTSLAFCCFADNGGVKFMRINDNGGSISLPSSDATNGFFCASRDGSSSTRMYKNGTSFATPNATSFAVDNFKFRIAWVGDGDGNKDPTMQHAAFTIGSNMQGGSDAANLYTRLRTYMTAVGVP